MLFPPLHEEVDLHVPLPDGVLQLSPSPSGLSPALESATQHWYSVGPGQYPGMLLPLHAEVFWQSPPPCGVLHDCAQAKSQRERAMRGRSLNENILLRRLMKQKYLRVPWQFVRKHSNYYQEARVNPSYYTYPLRTCVQLLEGTFFSRLLVIATTVPQRALL